MGFQKVEFEFPDDEDNVSIDVEPSSATAMDDDDPKPKEKAAKPAKEEDDDLDIEVVDDTPPEDRGREPSEPPEEVSDAELENYSEKVRKRIQRFSKGYHDERRARETAERERDELERVTRQLVDERNKWKNDTTRSNTALVEQAKRQATSELAEAKRKFKEAYESGDSDAVTEAQDNLNAARNRFDRVSNFKVPALQEEKDDVKQDAKPTREQQKPPAKQTLSPRTSEWVEKNQWFLQPENKEMQYFALGYHQKLVEDEGIDPESDAYYEKLDARMRQVFPDHFSDENDDDDTSTEKSERPRSTSSVAPVTRSTASKKVRLTRTQVALAKRLGVPLEEYAREVANQRRNDNA